MSEAAGAARTLRALCPTCGGTMPRGEGSRAETCPFCGHRSVLVGGSETTEELRSVLPAAFGPEEATDRMRLELVERGVLSKRLAGEVRFGEARLFFVPYLWLSAIRPSIVTRPVASRIDTRVQIDDFEAFKPAADLPGWGLEALDPGVLLSRPEAELPVTCDATELRRQGLVVAPQHGFSDLREWGAWGATDVSGENKEVPELICERRRILYLPVYDASYELQGQRYEARLDGSGGSLLAGRGPEDATWRVPIALVATALPGLLLGKLLAFGVDHGGGSLLLLGAAVVVTLMVGLAGFAWSLLRFEAEHVYERGLLWSEQLGAGQSAGGGAAHLFDRLAGAALRLVEGPPPRGEP